MKSFLYLMLIAFPLTFLFISPDASYAYEDLTYDAVISASSQYNGDMENAFDDNETTYWRTASYPVKDNEWISVDFGESQQYAVDLIRIRGFGRSRALRDANPGDFIVQGSNESEPDTTKYSSDWTILTEDTYSCYTGTICQSIPPCSNDGNWENFFFSNETGYRHIRIWFVTGGSSGQRMIIDEIEMVDLPDLTYGMTISASSQYNGAKENAIDDDEESYWRALSYPVNDNEWFSVDFGESQNYAVNKIRIRGFGRSRALRDANPGEFIVQASIEAAPDTSKYSSDWTTLTEEIYSCYTGTIAQSIPPCSNDGNWEDFLFQNDVGYRHIRLWFESGGSSGQRMIIDEIEMFGLEAP